MIILLERELCLPIAQLDNSKISWDLSFEGVHKASEEFDSLPEGHFIYTCIQIMPTCHQKKKKDKLPSIRTQKFHRDKY
jgi:hypothetical protein